MDGLRIRAIARRLGCHEQTVRRWLVRFNAAGIEVHRSHMRRVLAQEGMRWRGTRSWIRSKPRIRPKGARIVTLYTKSPDGVTVLCGDELGPVIPRTFPLTPGRSADGHRVTSGLGAERGPEKTWISGALRPADGHEVTMAASSRNSANYQRVLQMVEQVKPAGACRLNLPEGRWRLLRRTATALDTAWLNARARHWVALGVGTAPPPHRRLRRRFVYSP